MNDHDRGPARDLDRDETHQESQQPDRSRTYRLFAWLSDNLLLVASVIGLGGFVLMSLLDYQLPRNLRVIGLAALIAIPFAGRPTAKRVKAMLWDPSYIWIIDLDARYQKGAIYRTTSQRFREWDVIDGQLDWLTPNLCVGKNVELEEQRVEGTWRGTLSDRELLKTLQSVEECRGQLEEDAQRGFAVEAQAFAIIRNTTRRAVRSIVETFERGTLPDSGEGLNHEINEAIEQFGIERKVSPEEDDDSPTADVPGLDMDLDPELADLATAGRSTVQGDSDD